VVLFAGSLSLRGVRGGAGIGLSFQLCSGCGAADSAAGKIDSDAQPLKGCLISMNLRYR
jgi:hypothetical protein